MEGVERATSAAKACPGGIWTAHVAPNSPHEAHRVIPLHRPGNRVGQIIEDSGVSTDTAAPGIGQVGHPLGSARKAGQVCGHPLGSGCLQRAVGGNRYVEGLPSTGAG